MYEKQHVFFLCLSLVFNKAFAAYLELRLEDHQNGDVEKVVLSCRFDPRNQVNTTGGSFDGSRSGGKNTTDDARTGIILPSLRIGLPGPYTCYYRPEYRKKSRRRTIREAEASIQAHLGVCPPGYRIDQDRCFPCFPGSYTSGQEKECYLCPKNFYMPDKAADSCWPCPDSRKTVGIGADSEDQCIFLDSNGNQRHALPTKWVVVITCVTIFIVCLCFILLILYFGLGANYWRSVCVQKTRKTKPPKYPERDRFLRKQDEDHIYESIPHEWTENIYEDVREEDEYEEPIVGTGAEYIEVRPDLPPKRFRKSRSTNDLNSARKTLQVLRTRRDSERRCRNGTLTVSRSMVKPLDTKATQSDVHGSLKVVKVPRVTKHAFASSPTQTGVNKDRGELNKKRELNNLISQSNTSQGTASRQQAGDSSLHSSEQYATVQKKTKDRVEANQYGQTQLSQTAEFSGDSFKKDTLAKLSKTRAEKLALVCEKWISSSRELRANGIRSTGRGCLAIETSTEESLGDSVNTRTAAEANEGSYAQGDSLCTAPVPRPPTPPPLPPSVGIPDLMKESKKLGTSNRIFY